MYRKFSLGSIAVAILSGCGQPVNDMRLTLAQNELRQECFGDDTYSCRNKTIDFNIMVLKLTPFKNDHDHADVIKVFGSKGWDLYSKVVDDFIDEGETTFDKMRPNIFARWFFGDSQPVSRQGYITAFTEEDQKQAMQEVQKRFLARAKVEGLKLTDEAQEEYEAAVAKEKQALAKPAEPTPPAAQIVLPQQKHIQTESDPALTKAITQFTSHLPTDGGGENTDLRRILKTDLNNDGVPDAVVIYVIEGEGGAQQGYTFITGFIQQNGSWAQASLGPQIGGLVQSLSEVKPGTMSVEYLTGGPDDPDCCPSVHENQQFVWSDGKFTAQPVTN